MNLTVAPFTRLFPMIVNNEQTTMLPMDKTELTNIFVVATY